MKSLARTLAFAAACWPALTAAALGAQPPATTPVAPQASSATPQPESSVTPMRVTRGAASHFFSAGRKAPVTYGYMKQASDDRDGLSRLQDQARQLRPPR